MRANLPSRQLAYEQLPDAAMQALEEGLIGCGFSSSAIVKDYPLFSEKASMKLNALVFAHPFQYNLNDYASITVYNAANGYTDSDLVKEHLAASSAPFHLIHREDRFSLWVSKATVQGRKTSIDPVKKEDSISYEHLKEVLHKYGGDLKPERIIDVKKGRDSFTFFPDIHPWQLSLWALEVRSKPLVQCFSMAINTLREHISSEQAKLIATQLLGLLIFVDTGMFGLEFLQRRPFFERLVNIASSKFHTFFSPDLLLREHREVAEMAYEILSQISYTGFVPEMLGDLYAAAYTPEARKALGNYNTPLYIARRIWEMIPVEYLRPQERVAADMTCGLGSFLIAGYERFSQLSDVKEMSLQKCLYGNDYDPFFAQLAQLGLLYTTSRDDWNISQEDAFTWNWLQEHQPAIIIGNPPFGSGNEGTEKAFRFLDYALARLKPGGYLAMILPRSFAVVQEGSSIRQKLLESSDILEVWDLPQQVFQNQDITSRTTVLVLQKKESRLPSRHCVRVRTIQPATMKAFANTGIFTSSCLEVDQYLWQSTRRDPLPRIKNEYTIDYFTVLSRAQWEAIYKHCFPLGECTKHARGVRETDRESTRRSREVFWFPHVGRRSRDQVIPQPYIINYDKAEKILCSDTWPQSLGSPKVVFQYIQTPVWGRRIKAAIERRGYYVSNTFWAVSPNPGLWAPANLNLEVVAAILNWDVSNAWIVEHLKGSYISSYAIGTIPFPKDLSESDCTLLTEAVRELEQESASWSWGLPSLHFLEAQDRIDSCLKKAYHLDDELFRHLRRITQWNHHPLLTLDQLQASESANWFVSGVVDAINTEEGTIRLWIDGFDELQTVPIAPSMPGWLLRPNAAFFTKIPEKYRAQRHIEPQACAWGTFYPQPYVYMTEEELLEGIAQQFASKEQG